MALLRRVRKARIFAKLFGGHVEKLAWVAQVCSKWLDLRQGLVGAEAEGSAFPWAIFGGCDRLVLHAAEVFGL